jgi:hypothetical protein
MHVVILLESVLCAKQRSYYSVNALVYQQHRSARTGLATLSTANYSSKPNTLVVTIIKELNAKILRICEPGFGSLAIQSIHRVLYLIISTTSMRLAMRWV